MECVGLQGFAGIFLRHSIQRAGSCDVDGQRYQKDDDSEDAGLYVNRAKEESSDAFVNYVKRREQQQASFHKRRKILEFTVAVGMTLVCRQIGNTDGEKCNDCGDEVETGVQRFREN